MGLFWSSFAVLKFEIQRKKSVGTDLRNLGGEVSFQLKDFSSPDYAYLKGQKKKKTRELEFESALYFMTLGQFPHL